MVGGIVPITSSRSLWRTGSCLATSVLAFALLTSCAGSGDGRRAELLQPPPRWIELQDEPSISTMHFPRGLYSLDQTEADGYYYRAPVHLTMHSFGGSVPEEGGIFLRRDDWRQLCGYVVWAGGRTKIGDLSQVRFTFRN